MKLICTYLIILFAVFGKAYAHVPSSSVKCQSVSSAHISDHFISPEVAARADENLLRDLSLFSEDENDEDESELLKKTVVSAIGEILRTLLNTGYVDVHKQLFPSKADPFSYIASDLYLSNRILLI